MPIKHRMQIEYYEYSYEMVFQQSHRLNLRFHASNWPIVVIDCDITEYSIHFYHILSLNILSVYKESCPACSLKFWTFCLPTIKVSNIVC